MSAPGNRMDSPTLVSNGIYAHSAVAATSNDEIDLTREINNFFHGDKVKTELWFRTKNPMLGELSPRDMIRYGRMEKLIQIVREAFNLIDG